MHKITNRFARFYAPGTFFAEEWNKPAETLDPEAVDFPDNAFAFTLHERIDIVDGDATYEGKTTQVGLRYYHADSKVETLDEVRRNPKATQILISNMECNRWDRVVWTRWGNWPQPFDPAKDCVLPRADGVTLARELHG